MNDLEFEIWLLKSDEKVKRLQNRAALRTKVVDEFLKNEPFQKYFNENASKYAFYFSYPADSDNEYWKDKTPEGIIRQATETIQRQTRRFTEKYYKIIVDDFGMF